MNGHNPKQSNKQSVCRKALISFVIRLARYSVVIETVLVVHSSKKNISKKNIKPYSRDKCELANHIQL
jgi:hypothetical protein